MSKHWQAYAEHILDAISKLRRIEQRGGLTQDGVLYDAALRNRQTLSDATQRLPASLKQYHADIPWKQISGFRNILVHDYLGNIGSQTVLAVLQEYLQPLEYAVRAMSAGITVKSRATEHFLERKQAECELLTVGIEQLKQEAVDPR